MKGLEIKQKRKQLGYTQEELAIRLGVSVKTISNYENGEIIPESKKALLRNVLFDNNIDTFNEPIETYIKASPNEIEEIEEVIREREKYMNLILHRRIIKKK